MTSFHRRILICAGCFVAVTGALALLSWTVPLPAALEAPGAASLWTGRARAAIARWGAVASLGVTVIVVAYLCTVAWQLRDDIRRLRTAVQKLGSPEATLDLDGFAYTEVRACAADLSTIAEWLRSEQGRLTDDATRDALTGLPNRRALMSTLEREVAAAGRTGWPLSVIMVDLDRFKALNDTYGHQAGDFVLKRAGERMASLVRQMDMVARFGGEEFAIILPNASLAQGMEIAWQLCNALRCDILVIDEHSIKVSASFGVAELHACGLSGSDALVKQADVALYQAKESGRDTVVAASKVEETSQAAGASEQSADAAIEPAASERSATIDADTMALMGSTFSVMQVIPDRHRVAHDILQQVVATLECRQSSLFMFDEGSGTLLCVASIGGHGYAADPAAAVSDELNDWFSARRESGQALSERTVELIEGESAGEGGSGKFIRIPLTGQDGTLGVIEVADVVNGTELTARQRGLLTAVCLIGATALRTCELFKVQEDRWAGLLEALCRVIETEKSYKRDHAVNGSSMCVDIARSLGQYDEQELRLLRLAALVHDIGEIGIPKRIRDKKGKLRTNEWKCVQEHCRISAELIDEASSMSRLAKIVLHHHEHYDGNGYPDGLVGEQIPLESRIIAVADAYVAMTSDRPYRAKLTDAVAIQRIMTASGSQFDPVVVNAFVQCCSTRAMAEYEQRPQRLPALAGAMDAHSESPQDDVAVS